jgi:two-component sensor histidine kinase
VVEAPSNGSSLFTFRWQETGGPPVLAPTRKGFGTAVLEQVMAEYGGVRPSIDFAISGMNYEVVGSLNAPNEPVS